MTPAMHTRARQRKGSGGFTLVELSVVLVISSILLSALLGFYTVWNRTAQRNATQTTLEDLQQAVMGFVLLQGRLPCPDTNGDGLEDAPCLSLQNTTAGVAWGQVPYGSLGVNGRDGWQNLIDYAVPVTLTQTASGLLNAIQAQSNLRVVCSTTGTAAPLCVSSAGEAVTLAANASAVFISHGANGRGAGNAPPAPVSTDELANMPNLKSSPSSQTLFVSRFPTGIDSPLGEFDDQVGWVSAQQLASLLVRSGLWP